MNNFFLTNLMLGKALVFFAPVDVYLNNTLIWTTDMIDLAIVIVNYNTSDLLKDCLTSIQQSQGDFVIKVCVVDNASHDDSVTMVGTTFPKVTVIASDKNEGFSTANNHGLRHFGYGQKTDNLPRYALLLNPDTKLPADALSAMITYMDNTPDAGAAGPKLVLLDGSLDLACRRSFPTPEISFYHMTGLSKLFPRHPKFARYNMTHLSPDQLTEVDSVVGAFMMVRTEAILTSGLMDETYFMYGEDLDWAYNIKAQGWKIYYNPAISVLHVKRAASRRSSKAQVEFYRAMEIFYRKHYERTTARWLHYLILAGIRFKWALTYFKIWVNRSQYQKEVKA
ncbi:MAG: glycosyltransferase family 2 protein [Chloroflexota bacterium]